VSEIDDHQNHIQIHRNFQRSERYEFLDPKNQEIVLQHQAAHEQYAAQQAAHQTAAASVSPIAATLPTMETKPVTPQEVEAAKSLSEQAPSNIAAPPGGPAPAATGPAPSSSPPAPSAGVGGGEPPSPQEPAPSDLMAQGPPQQPGAIP
jgi:hypothetical protein